MTARNAPCPCGSGRKYKHCHGAGGARAGGDPQRRLEQARSLAAGGRLPEALEIAERLPDGLPKDELLSGLYLARRAAGDADRARQALRRWSKRDPASPGLWQRRVELALFEGAPDDAREPLAELETRAPGAPHTHYYRGIVEQLGGDLDAAMDAYRLAITAGSPLPSTAQETELDAAIELLETAAGQYPGSPGLDEARLMDRPREYARLAAAADAWQDAWRRSPAPLPADRRTRFANARYNLGCACLGDFQRAAEAGRQFTLALEIDPEHAPARINRAFVANYDDALDPGEIAALHRALGAWLTERHPADLPARGEGRAGRLRVAYLSSDLRRHSVAYFLLPVLERHDHEAFEVFAYHTGQQSDAVTARVRSAVDCFRDVSALDDAQLLERIRGDGVDLLVDLNGLTRGHRLAVLARRAAPVQVTWLGYPNTTGLATVDHRIVDAVTDPRGAATPWHSEHLVRMDRVFSVYDPLDELPEPAPLPAHAAGHVTFGSFNFLPKLSSRCLRAWAEILRRAPGSRLLLKNLALDFETPRARLLAAFSELGIASDQLEIVGRTADRAAHFAHYHRVDLCLDSFPYNGTTTTCDALWMGVPVLALAGEDHRGRVGASQLGALGLESLVASDDNGYIETAVRLARDLDRLAELRAGLRRRMRASPLTDAEAFTRELEGRYQAMWARRRDAGAPGE